MNLEQTFLILGVVYFVLSILIIVVALVFSARYYMRFKKQLDRFKSGYSVVSRSAGWIGKQSPVLVTFVSALLAGVLKSLKSYRKRKNSKD